MRGRFQTYQEAFSRAMWLKYQQKVKPMKCEIRQAADGWFELIEVN